MLLYPVKKFFSKINSSAVSRFNWDEARLFPVRVEPAPGQENAWKVNLTGDLNLFEEHRSEVL